MTPQIGAKITAPQKHVTLFHIDRRATPTLRRSFSAVFLFVGFNLGLQSI